MTLTHLLLIALDLALVLLATLRLTRFVITDDLGDTIIVRPLLTFAARVLVSGRAFGFLRTLLSCPFCIGFWLGAGVLASLSVIGGPGAEGTAAVVWRYVLAAFALNWIVGHVGSRVGDAGYADDEDGDEHR